MELRDWQLNAGASEDAIHGAVASLGHSLPEPYVQFLRDHNGGEGFVGNNYLILWKVEELVPFNREYEVNQYAQGIFLFGSNGGGETDGFDMRDSVMPVVRIPFIGMDGRDAIVISSTFSGLFEKLK